MNPVRGLRLRRSLGMVLAVVVVVLVLGACGDDGGDDTAGTQVRPFEEVQVGELAFEADPLDPSRGIFRVETSEPMICAIVWGETDEYGRFNNSLSMAGTGIIDHDVVLPDVVSGTTYHYVVQGTTADGALYRSEPGTFTIDADAVVDSGEPSVEVGENLAPSGAVVDASSEFSDAFAASLAIDDDLATEWSTAGDGNDGFITIRLGSPTQVAAVEFVTRSMADGSAVTDTFTVSVDGGEPLGPFDAASPATRRVVALDVTGTELRFEVERSTGGNVGAVEIRLFAPP